MCILLREASHIGVQGEKEGLAKLLTLIRHMLLYMLHRSQIINKIMKERCFSPPYYHVPRDCIVVHLFIYVIMHSWIRYMSLHSQRNVNENTHTLSHILPSWSLFKDACIIYVVVSLVMHYILNSRNLDKWLTIQFPTT